MAVKLSDMKIGSTVVVKTWDGKSVKGKVTDIDQDIKNGRPGICYDDFAGEGWWCYLDQVSQVVKK